MYSEITRSIKVTVRPFYLEQHSSPDESHYVWAYHVRIENCGEETVQLRNRHWRITDSLGHLQEVRGPGVVGEQPVLAPGKSFEPVNADAVCKYMKMITLTKLRDALRNKQYRVTVDPEIATRAQGAIQRMVAIS